MDTILEYIRKCDSNTLLTFAIFISIFIEIAPIKINPLSAIFKWIGKIANKDIDEKLNTMSTKLEDVSNKMNTIENRIDMIEINDMRSTILDFANSCMNERKHTLEEFNHVIDIHTQYEEKIIEKGIKNGRVDLAYKYISDLYTRCLNENSFLDS